MQARRDTLRVADPVSEGLVPAVIDDEGSYPALVRVADLLPQTFLCHDGIQVFRSPLETPAVIIEIRFARQAMVRDLTQQIVCDRFVGIRIRRQDAERGPDGLIPALGGDRFPIQVASVPDPVPDRQAPVREMAWSWEACS